MDNTSIATHCPHSQSPPRVRDKKSCVGPKWDCLLPIIIKLYPDVKEINPDTFINMIRETRGPNLCTAIKDYNMQPQCVLEVLNSLMSYQHFESLHCDIKCRLRSSRAFLRSSDT
uniref:Uncharacterized protein n=1 Tax=Cacopsylla melanoneura TaxID=428564 RepID=A0A8D9E348_9HEMI